MCYLNRTANTCSICSICISNSDRLGCGSVQRSTWAGLMGYNYWACYKYRGLFHTVPLPGNAGHVLPLGEILKSETDRQRLKPMNDMARIKASLLDAQTASKGHKRQWNSMHMRSSDDVLWTWATNIYQQIFASRGDVEPLPNLEVTEMKAMCSTCLVHFFGADPFLFGLT